MRAAWLFLSVTLFGCSTVRVDPDDPTPGETDPGPESDPQPVALVGTWVGFVENFEFDDASDRVELRIASESAGAVTGTVRFGERALYAPPTDPDAGYPPGYTTSSRQPDTGFELTLLNATFSGSRLKFSFDPREIWSAWCELQTPIHDDVNPGNYGCLPNWGTMMGATCSQPDPNTGMNVPVDCVKMQLCSFGACGCEATGCSIPLAPIASFDLTVDLTVGSASGSAVDIDYDGDARSVQLTREPQ